MVVVQVLGMTVSEGALEFLGAVVLVGTVAVLGWRKGGVS